MAVGSGYQRISETNFSGGMFPAMAPELIPPNGAFDITNGLLDEQNVCYRRGGTTYITTKTFASGVRMLWSGLLKKGSQTLLSAAGATWKIDPFGEPLDIKLASPAFLMAPTAFQGVLYLYGGITWDGEKVGATDPKGIAPHYATAANRLLAGANGRVTVSGVPKVEGEALTWADTDYLAFPEGVTITGMTGWRTSCVVFTTQGIYVISGLTHNIVDETGNVQWSQDRYSADAVLWGEAGVAAWKGGLVVPCRDDVWVMELGVSSERSAPFRAISSTIRSLYRGYVAQGYMPGQAIVFNGHYLLPILNGEAVVDVLVCRLEAAPGSGATPSPAWTHFKGFGAGIAAFATRNQGTELIGVNASTGQVLKLGYFSPGKTYETDANGEIVPFEITTRSIPTGNLVPNTVGKARLSYRMVAEPATKLDLSFGSSAYGAEWGAFNWNEANWVSFSGPFTSLGEAIPPAKADPMALVPKTWRVGKKIRYARMKITLEGTASQVSIRGLELFVRDDGRVV